MDSRVQNCLGLMRTELDIQVKKLVLGIRRKDPVKLNYILANLNRKIISIKPYRRSRLFLANLVVLMGC